MLCRSQDRQVGDTWKVVLRLSLFLLCSRIQYSSAGGGSQSAFGDVSACPRITQKDDVECE